MWINTLNPVLLSLGPLEIRWYGISYVLGFFLTIWWMQYMRKKRELNLSKDEVWDFGFWILVGIIIGSRLFEVFWEPGYYFSNPLRFFYIWQGGMSFHGGFVGTLVAVYLYSKKKKLNIAKVFDILAVPTILGLGLGRIANFINGELWGRPFNGSWCVVFPQKDNLCRHPSVLYEAGKRFLIFGWLLFLALKNKFKPGFIALNFVLWEGLGRFIVDFYRDENVFYFGNLFTMGQILSSFMVIIATFLLFKNYSKEWKKIF
ncbi:prolipoprotein diacylglyceryl transferase [Candidatus Woesearchaeota archaeon CG10_big_fil_rev_8_21_14_0_10_32_24]|nr:MAG: prolipoprotein diacylglyceryl transferase [Candidatus Woesearchaeota archaeon CG10_big_fil_rev_8_21_14_0_10_32_24]